MENELVIPEQNSDEISSLRENITTYIGALGVINSKNKILKKDPDSTGTIYDYQTKKSLGNSVIMTSLMYRMKFTAMDKDKTFIEGIYAHRPADGIYANLPEVVAFKEKHNKALIEETLDSLVYLPEFNIIRHFNFKGKLASGGVDLIDGSRHKGVFIPCRVDTVFCEYKTHDWYELSVSPLMNKTVEFPAFTKKYIELFLSAKKEEDESPTVAPGRER